MQLDGLITVHSIPTVKTVLEQCIGQLCQSLEAFDVDHAAFRNGETDVNPIEARSGVHTYRTNDRRISASYQGPTYAIASLSFRSGGDVHELRIPAPWDVDDSLPGIARLALSLLQCTSALLADQDQCPEERHPDVIGADPLPWLAALSALAPSQDIEDVTLKTPSTPSAVEGQYADRLIERFDRHCPAFLSFEMHRRPGGGDIAINLHPVEGDYALHDGRMNPIERMRMIADAVTKGALPPFDGP